MLRRWSTPTLGADELPLVVLWKEMLAATGIPAHRASQLIREGQFPIPQLPYFGLSSRIRRRLGRYDVDTTTIAFSKAQVLKFIALEPYERERLTLLDYERPTCCQCPFHCPKGEAAQPHPYAQRFKRWWSQ